jgi:M6 family metalloprotease-like protein
MANSYKRPISFAIALLFSFTLLPFLSPASAADLALCRIKASERENVSLGFPLSNGRLAAVKNPKIMVIPFRMKEKPNYVISELDKEDYKNAAKDISDFSGGKASVEFIFAPVLDTDYTKDTWITLKANQQKSFQDKDESLSTWGFVRALVAASDPKVDFSDIDAVILEGSPVNWGSFIGEAMMFRTDEPNGYARPITTDEAIINNAILLDQHYSRLTITHEVLHLFGLTDLYGTSTGPGKLSLMAGDSPAILSYEKWILGWLPDSAVQCFPDVATNAITDIKIDPRQDSQVIVLPGKADSHIIIETSRIEESKYLALYTLNNETRPPITTFADNQGRSRDGLQINSYKAIGTIFDLPDFSLVVSDLNGTAMTLKLLPKQLRDTPTNATLIEEAARNLKNAEASSSVSPKKPIKNNTVTITCLKGKIQKKVTAVKPVCPKGYKKKN